MRNNREGADMVRPDKLLAGFLKGRIVVFLLIAVGIHVVFITVTSLGYIRDRWIDPKGAELRKKAAQEALQAELDKAAPPVPAATGTNAPAAAASTGTVAAATNAVAKAPAAKQTQADADARILEERKDTPMAKRITEKANTNEIPKAPSDLGISLEETEIK